MLRQVVRVAARVPRATSAVSRTTPSLLRSTTAQLRHATTTTTTTTSATTSSTPYRSVGVFRLACQHTPHQQQQQHATSPSTAYLATQQFRYYGFWSTFKEQLKVP